MYMYITPSGVCIGFHELTYDVIGICSENHGFMLSLWALKYNACCKHLVAYLF